MVFTTSVELTGAVHDAVGLTKLALVRSRFLRTFRLMELPRLFGFDVTNSFCVHHKCRAGRSGEPRCKLGEAGFGQVFDVRPTW